MAHAVQNVSSATECHDSRQCNPVDVVPNVFVPPRLGFQSYAKNPVLITTLRNPLELFVSGEQYLNRRETATLPQATSFVADAMRLSLSHRKLPGYLHRLVGRSVSTTEEIREATVEAAYNLDTFWLVGVVEQYEGFITVLQHLLDPWDLHPDLWREHLGQKLNASPVTSTKVLAKIHPQLLRDFNETLTYQWLVYGRAVDLYVDRCLEVLPHAWQRAKLCHVPAAPSEYW